MRECRGGVFWLQWGHVLSDMVTGSPRPVFRRLPVLLQWGHVLSDMVTARDCILSTKEERASMGPCPFRHGNRMFPSVSSRISRSASMGPCPFRHGNRCESCSIEKVRDASMGPCPFRHGNAERLLVLVLVRRPGRASMGPCPFRHGNGENVSDMLLNVILASMGPCPFRHGNSLQSIFTFHVVFCFNGAMSFQTW